MRTRVVLRLTRDRNGGRVPSLAMCARLAGDCFYDDECHIVDRLGVAAKSSKCIANRLSNCN